jgi:hypothetical protein
MTNLAWHLILPGKRLSNMDNIFNKGGGGFLGFGEKAFTVFGRNRHERGVVNQAGVRNAIRRKRQ